MKGWTIYSFYTGLDDCPEHFPSKRAAETRAREVLAETGLSEIEIEKNETVPMTRAVLINLLNSGGGWCRNTEIVSVIRPRSGQQSG